MFPTDPTGELTRQRVADLHAMAARERLASRVAARSVNRTTTLRRRATVALVVAALLVAVIVNGGGRLP